MLSVSPEAVLSLKLACGICAVNYHHWGEAKRWYSVPASAAEAFESAFRTALPELFAKQPDVLFHLVTMLSPRILQAAGVPVYGISQVCSAISGKPVSHEYHRSAGRIRIVLPAKLSEAQWLRICSGCCSILLYVVPPRTNLSIVMLQAEYT